MLVTEAIEHIVNELFLAKEGGTEHIKQRFKLLINMVTSEHKLTF